MLINPPKEWMLNVDKTTGQAAGQVPAKLKASSEFVAKLMETIGDECLSVKSMMERLGLKGRDNFLNTYLNPAVKEGFVALLYLDSPRHPRQKYLLTVRGWTVYKNLKQ